jgi:GxxExxY protein
MVLMADAPYSEVTFRIIRCAMRVHSAVGPGMLEEPYKLALAAEMSSEGLSFDAEVRLPFHYKGRVLGNAYVMDFVVGDLVVIEVKAVELLLPVHRAQLTSYLRLSGHPAGLLLNFNVTSMSLGIVRVLNDRKAASKNSESEGRGAGVPPAPGDE